MTTEERQEAAKWFQNRASHTPMPGAKMMFERAAEALSEGVQPQRKKGHWIRHITTGLGPKLNDTIECSECRIAFSTENMFRRSFCPNCGADMRGEKDD